MSRSPRQPVQLAGTVFRGSAAIAAGLLSKEDLRSTAWRRLFRGVYVDAKIMLTYRLRCKAVLWFVGPPGSVLAGATAVHFHGGLQAGALDDVVLLVPCGSRLRTGHGIRVHTESLEPNDLRFVRLTPPKPSESFDPASPKPARSGPNGLDLQSSKLGQSESNGLDLGSSKPGPSGSKALPSASPKAGRRTLRVTSPERTCWDVARWTDVVEAVVLIDTLLAKGITSIPILREYALARSDRRGWGQLLRVCELADPGAESPPESRVRVRLVLAGVPKPQTQYVIRREGTFIARVDMAWPDQKVAVEYEGAWHDSPGQFDKDRARLNKLMAEGWLILHLTARRTREDFPGFTAELKSALRSRSGSPRT